MDRFAHNDLHELERLIKQNLAARKKIIVCDGIYPADGNTAPLLEFAYLANLYDCVIYVDDAHGIGLLGENPSKNYPYGRGGKGTPQYMGVSKGNIIHVGSLSKAFSTPLAYIAGPNRFLKYLKLNAPTFLHSSPPDFLTLGAALRSLQISSSYEGDIIRKELADQVKYFRRELEKAGIKFAKKHIFPIQTIHFANIRNGLAFAHKLRKNSIWPVLQLYPQDNPKGAAIRFVITALHRKSDIDEAVAIISYCIDTYKYKSHKFG